MFNVVGTKVLAQSGSEAVAGKKTGSVLPPSRCSLILQFKVNFSNHTSD